MESSLTPQRIRTLQSLFNGYDGPPFALRFWDGQQWSSPGGGAAQCTVVLQAPEALRRLLGSPDETALGEAYIDGLIEVEGDLFAVFDAAEHLFNRPLPLRQQALGALLRGAVRLGRWWRDGLIHSKKRDRSSISYHYNQPVEFYRPWLGETIAYSCAYFARDEAPLDEAQRAKLELICRKLRLAPGERFLDVGCGWGSLILHAAQAHGATARGITLSSLQAATAVRRINEAGLEKRCRVQLVDYRDLGGRASYDKIASVGMFEHVGLAGLRQYFRTLHGALRPGGALLNHGIVRAPNSPRRPSSFIDKYVFPDGALVTLAEVVAAAEAEGFEVRDTENLREHYDLTLQRWVEGLRAHRTTLLQHVPEKTYRIWELYMAGSAASFRRGAIAVHQLLLSKPDRGRSHLPLRREDWYATGARAELSAV